MNCKTVQQDMENRTAPFSASELDAMDPHLASCAGCRKIVANFQKLVPMFKKEFPAQEILESLSRKVLAHSEIRTAVGDEPKMPARGFPWTLWTLVPALGCLLIFALMVLPRNPAPVTSRPGLVSAWVWGKVARQNAQGQTVDVVASGSEIAPGQSLILPPATNCRLELASGTLLQVFGAGRLQVQPEELTLRRHIHFVRECPFQILITGGETGVHHYEPQRV